MRLALIKNGFVYNVVEADVGFHSEADAEISSEIANIGDRWDGEKIIPQLPIYQSIELPEKVSTVVTRYQVKKALSKAGILAEVEKLMVDPSTPELTRIAWTEAPTFERYDSMMENIATIMGLSNEQLDALFVAAITG